MLAIDRMNPARSQRVETTDLVLRSLIEVLHGRLVLTVHFTAHAYFVCLYCKVPLFCLFKVLIPGFSFTCSYES